MIYDIFNKTILFDFWIISSHRTEYISRYIFYLFNDPTDSDNYHLINFPIINFRKRQMKLIAAFSLSLCVRSLFFLFFFGHGLSVEHQFEMTRLLPDIDPIRTTYRAYCSLCSPFRSVPLSTGNLRLSRLLSGIAQCRSPTERASAIVHPSFRNRGYPGTSDHPLEIGQV